MNEFIEWISTNILHLRSLGSKIHKPRQTLALNSMMWCECTNFFSTSGHLLGWEKLQSFYEGFFFFYYRVLVLVFWWLLFLEEPHTWFCLLVSSGGAWETVRCSRIWGSATYKVTPCPLHYLSDPSWKILPYMHLIFVNYSTAVSVSVSRGRGVCFIERCGHSWLLCGAVVYKWTGGKMRDHQRESQRGAPTHPTA